MWIPAYWAWHRSLCWCLPLIVRVWFLAGVFPSIAAREAPRGDLMRPGIECRCSDNFLGLATGLWPGQIRYGSFFMRIVARGYNRTAQLYACACAPRQVDAARWFELI